jgi:hypothetical protein
VPVLRSHLLDNNTEGIITVVKDIAEYAKQHEETVDPMVEEGAIQALSNVLAAEHPADRMYVPARPPPARLSRRRRLAIFPQEMQIGHKSRRLEHTDGSEDVYMRTRNILDALPPAWWLGRRV